MPNVGYEVGSSVTVRALHQMPMPGPRKSPRPRLPVRCRAVGRGELDEHGMVHLDVLRAAMQAMAARIEVGTRDPPAPGRGRHRRGPARWADQVCAPHSGSPEPRR